MIDKREISFPCIGLHAPCVSCGTEVSVFRDLESLNEAEISGLCQKCQDEIWLDDEEAIHIEELHGRN